MTMTNAKKLASRLLGSCEGFDGAWESAMDGFKHTEHGKRKSDDRKIWPLRGDTGECEIYQVEGKSGIFIQHIGTGWVVQIGVKDGIAKYLGWHNDREEAMLDGFSESDIERHVAPAN